MLKTKTKTKKKAKIKKKELDCLLIECTYITKRRLTTFNNVSSITRGSDIWLEERHNRWIKYVKVNMASRSERSRGR